MPRLPTKADLPSSLTLSIIPPPSTASSSSSSTTTPTHVLLLLHGLGDTHDPFTRLAAQLALPGTVCIALRALTPLPFDLPGFHWGDDILFDEASGGMDVDTGFNKASEVVATRIIRDVLVQKCAFRTDEILIYGFGQGGMVGLAAARKLQEEKSFFGGVITIGGPLAEGSRKKEAEEKCKTPVLVLGGSSRSLITVSAARRIKESFGDVQFVQWKRAGDGMPSNREEMLPIMQFFAKRLRSRAPRGTVEIS